MSVETIIQIVPVERQWTATPLFVKELLEYLGATSVSVVSYAGPYEWNREPGRTARSEKLTIDGAVSTWVSRGEPVTSFFPEGTAWDEKTYQAFCQTDLGTEPIEPGYVCILTGPQTIGDDFRGTIAEVNFRIVFGADNTPESSEYFEQMVQRIGPLLELVEYLKQLTGIDWEILVTYSV